MRVVNSTRDAIYVDATQNRLGLSLQRDVMGQLYPFDELACQCDYCSSTCSHVACACPDAGAMVRRISPDGGAERAWDGVVQVAGQCAAQGSCLNQENAPLNEPFTLKLCFSTQQPSGVTQFDDAGVAPGQVEILGQTCVQKTFMIQDTVVEIGPEHGSSCVSTADCKGADELCFSGSCTTGCQANTYPAPGSSNLGLSIDDRGFFSQAPTLGGGTRSTGTGTITSTVYVGTTLKIYLSRPGSANEPLTGQLSIVLPPSTGVPLQAGTKVSVTFLDNGQEQAALNRAVLIRDAISGELLFAGDMAQGGPMLTDGDLAPFLVSSGAVPIGCRRTSCGRHLYYKRRLSSGADAVEVEPGKQGVVVLQNGTWTLLSISDGAFVSTSCDVSDMRPWVVWRSR